MTARRTSMHLHARRCAMFAWCIVIASPAIAQPAPELSWQLIAEHAHDAQRFTQGFAYRDGQWLESSGGYHRSFVALERNDDDVPSARFDLPRNEFAEGATFAGDNIWLLTWRKGIARRFDGALNLLRTYRYRTEGWGLTYDGTHLVMSDGTHRLQFRDPEDFTVSRTLSVHDAMRPVSRLNELEYAHGLLWANVFEDTRIAVIDPRSGGVLGWLQLRELLERFDKPAGWNPYSNVLNGIAADDATGHLHVTGKHWPMRYEIAVELDGLRPAQRDE